VALAWVGGCSGHGDPGTATDASPTGEAHGAAHSAAGEVLPLDRLLGSTTEATELRRRWIAYRDGYPAAMTACVRAAGFGAFSEPVPDLPSDEELARVGADPRRFAEVLDDHAYGLSENVELQISNAAAPRGGGAEGALPTWRQELSPTERAALLAVEQRCQSEALRRFPHPNSLDVDSTAFVEVQSIRRSILGARPIAAIWQEWSTCLAGRGFHAPDRDALVTPMADRAAAVVDALDAAARSDGVLEDEHPAIVAARRALEPLAREERQAAAADAACSREVDLDQRVFDLQRRLEQAYIDEHGDELRSMVARAGGR
jgi:hypothetical protein